MLLRRNGTATHRLIVLAHEAVQVIDPHALRLRRFVRAVEAAQESNLRLLRLGPCGNKTKGSPMSIQALSKPCASPIQAATFCIQASETDMAAAQVLTRLEVLKRPPKYPYYNIKREKDVKRGAFLDKFPKRPM